MNRNSFRLPPQQFPLDAEKVKELIETQIIGTEKLRREKVENGDRRKATEVREGMKGRGGGMWSTLQQLWVIKQIYTHCLSP